MRKESNVTGSCNPEWHYMVDTAKRFEAVESLIDKGKISPSSVRVSLVRLLCCRPSGADCRTSIWLLKPAFKNLGMIRSKEKRPQWIERNGKRIFEVII